MQSEPIKFWHRPVIYRSAIGLYVALILALGAVAVSVNVIQVEGAVYLRGDTDLEKGRTHGLRGVFQYSPTGETLYPETMEWTLRSSEDEGAQPIDISMMDGPADEAWPDLKFRLDDDIPDGSYDLHVTASHEEVSELTATQPITVESRPEPASKLQELDWPQWRSRDADGTDDDRDVLRRTSEEEGVELAITPADGEIVRGHEQTVHLRSFDPETGRPIPATLSLDFGDSIVEGEPETTVHTDDFGFAAIDVVPVTSLNIEITVEPAPRRAYDPDHDEDAEGDDPEELPVQNFELRLNTVSAQYMATPTPSSRIVTPGDDIEAKITSTVRNSSYLVDLYDGTRLLDTLTLSMDGNDGGARFEAPKTSEVAPLLRLQSYQSIFGTENSWSSAYILLLESDDKEGLRQALIDLYSWIGEETESAHHRYIAFKTADEDLSERELRHLIDVGLQEVPRTFEMPPVIMNSRQTDREALAEWRDDVGDDLRLMMAVLLFIGFVVVSYFVVIGIRRHQREAAAMREVELESADPPAAEQRRAERLERLVTALQGAIVFLTIIGFALGILIVLSYL